MSAIPKTQSEKCRECRECCEYVEFPVTMLSLETIEYFLFRGEQMYIDQSNGVLMVRRHAPCQYLTNKGCSVYENRPETCRLFMCEHKDKSVKQAKNDLCRHYAIEIQKIIDARSNSREIRDYGDY